METITQDNQLTNRDIKFLKLTIWRQIFPSLTVSLFLFLIVFIYSGLNKNFGLISLILTLLCVFIGIIIFIIITRKLRMDLKTGQVMQEKEIVVDKIYKLDYESGSRTFPVNIFSLLFIKKISQIEMTEMHIYYIIVKGERIDVDKNDFEKIEKGETIIIRRTPKSDILLGVQIIQ